MTLSLRAIWRGELSLDAVTCAVALYAASSAAERMSFHLVNRKTGNRVQRRYIDSETGRQVDKDDIVKGYERDGHTLLLEPEDIRAAVPDSDKRLAVEAFVSCGDIDTAFLERPYFMLPGDDSSAETFALFKRALAEKKAVALARTVLFRRVRTLLIRTHGDAVIATTLNFSHEVRPAEEILGDIAPHPVDREMRDLAEHIITTKRAEFDPAAFTDRYEDALAELVKAKIAGRKPKALKRVAKSTGGTLLEALKRSAGVGEAKDGSSSAAGRKRRQSVAKRKKAS